MSNPPVNPYAKGLNVAGTGANGASTNFGVTWNPTIGAYGVQTAGGGFAPIYTASQFSNLANGFTSANGAQETFPGSGVTQAEYNANPEQYQGNYANNAYQAPTAGAALNIVNKGGGRTNVDYTLDPKTGYYVPNAMKGTGQDSWWQSTGLPLAAFAAVAAPAAATALGAGAATGAATGAAAPAFDAAALDSAFGAGAGALPGVPAEWGAATAASTALPAEAAAGLTQNALTGFATTDLTNASPSLLSKALSNPQLVGKALGALGNVAGLGSSGASGSGGGAQFGACGGGSCRRQRWRRPSRYGAGGWFRYCGDAEGNCGG